MFWCVDGWKRCSLGRLKCSMVMDVETRSLCRLLYQRGISKWHSKHVIKGLKRRVMHLGLTVPKPGFEYTMINCYANIPITPNHVLICFVPRSGSHAGQKHLQAEPDRSGGSVCVVWGCSSHCVSVWALCLWVCLGRGAQDLLSEVRNMMRCL